MIQNVNSNQNYYQTNLYLKKKEASYKTEKTADNNAGTSNETAETNGTAKIIISIEDLLNSMKRLKSTDNNTSLAASETSGNQSQQSTTSNQTETDTSAEQTQQAAARQAQIKSILNGIDADDDGNISSEEYDSLISQLGIDNAPSSKDFFSLFDTNSDGEVTSEEFDSTMESARPPMGPPPEGRAQEDAQSKISDIDTDGDGTISADEYNTFISKLGIDDAPSSNEFFTQFDANSDGEISAEELDSVNEKLKTADTQQNGPGVIPPGIDTDGDGKVSADEYDTLVSQMGAEDALSAEDFFKEYDTNADGEISEDEIIAGLEKKAQSTASKSTSTDNASDSSTSADSSSAESVSAQTLSTEYLRRSAKAANAYQDNFIYYEPESLTEDSII